MSGQKCKIFPTADSGLSAATYSVELPAPQQWTMIPERPKDSSMSISGAMVHTLWPADITTCKPKYKQTITEAQYNALMAIYQHATVTTWMLAIEGRLFEIGIGTPSGDRVMRGSRVMRDVEFPVSIVREVSL